MVPQRQDAAGVAFSRHHKGGAQGVVPLCVPWSESVGRRGISTTPEEVRAAWSFGAASMRAKVGKRGWRGIFSTPQGGGRGWSLSSVGAGPGRCDALSTTIAGALRGGP